MASTSLGSLFIDLLMKTGRFETDAGRAAKIAQRRSKEIERAFRGAFSTIGAGLAGFAAGLLSVNAVFGALKGAIDAADKLDEMSAKLGISTEKLSAWGYAAKLSGTDLDGLGRAIPKLSKTLADAADASSSAGKLFKGLGIDVKDAQGNLRDVEDVLPEIADRFKSLNNDTLETALAMQVFGKSGAELLEFLNRGSEGLTDFENRARRLGILIDGDTAAAAAKFKDELENLKAASSGLFTQIAAQLLPTLTETVTKFSTLVSNGQLAGNVVTVFSAALKAGVGILQVYNLAVDTLSARIEQLVRVMAGLAQAQANFSTLGLADGSVIGGLKGAARGFAAGEAGVSAAFQRFGAPAQGVQVLGSTSTAGTGQFANVNTSPVDAALEKRLNALLATSGGSGKAKGAGGKSEAQRAAEQLASAYASLNGSLAEQIALFGKVGQAAKVRYDVEFGSLKGLTQAEKDILIAQAEKLDVLEAEADVRRDLDSIAKQREQAFDRLHDDLKFEAELLGKTAAEQELLTALRYADIKAGSAQAKVIEAQIELNRRLREATADQVEAMDGLRDSARGFLGDLKDGEGIWDSLKNAADSFADTLFDIVANNLIEQIFGKQGDKDGGSWGDVLGSVLGSFFGGGRANGGSVLGGRMYEVNERGVPELLTVRNRQMLLMPPNVSGMVSPMRGAAAGGGMTVNFALYGETTRETQMQISNRLDRAQREAAARNR